MENTDLNMEKLEAKKTAVKITLGVLRAAVIINVIFYLVKLWSGQPVTPLVMLPAAACVVIGIFVHILRRRIEQKLP